MAKGDLSRKITVDVRGEIQELKSTTARLLQALLARWPSYNFV